MARDTLNKRGLAIQQIYRHSLHLGALRHAIICALDLGHHPAALDDNLLFIEIKLKANHSDLPPKRQYEPISGFTLTMAETREMLGITLFS